MTYSAWTKGILLGAAFGMAAGPRTAQAAAPTAGSNPSVQEVVVTAQRRAERLLDVPISVTALTAQNLAAAGVTSTLDLAQVTPGLQLAGTGTTVQPAIRGISTTVVTTENNVAIYVDDVYQAVPRSGTFDLPDTTAVEVLKGPQGTLFGRNATGGAILITTLKPDLQEVHGNAYVSYGNYNAVVVKGFVTVPLIKDKMALSVSGLVDYTSGWQKDLGRGGRTDGLIRDQMIRAKLRYLPWDGADFTLTGLYDNRRDDQSTRMSNINGNSIYYAPGVAGTISQPLATKPWEVSTNGPSWMGRLAREVSLHGDIEIGPGVFSTTTAFHRDDGPNRNDFDYTPVDQGINTAPNLTNTVEQEFLYTTHQIGRFHAVGGFFYYHYRTKLALNVSNGAFEIGGFDKTRSFAGFGEANYDLTDRISLTGGLRYTSETHIGTAALEFGFQPLPPLTQVGEHTWHSLTPRVSAVYKITPHTNGYGTFSKGFTSGIINTPSFQTTPVKPETVKAFEIGLKSSELRTVTFSAAAFHYDYTNLQVFAQQRQGLGVVINLSNAAKSKIYGGELNATWRVTPDFDLTAGGSYLHARYDSFPNAQLTVPTGLGGNMSIVGDASGKTMIRSPTWSGNLTAHYRKETEHGVFEAAGNVSYSSKIFYDFTDRVTQPAYALLSTNLTWQPQGTTLKLGVWGKNLSNRAVIQSAGVAASGDYASYLAPRTYGVSLQYQY